MQFTKTFSLPGDTTAVLLERGSKATGQVRALQMLLFALGYGAAMNWDKYKADGDYGGGTTRALKAFIDQNSLSGSGEQLTSAIYSKLQERYADLAKAKAMPDGTEKTDLLATLSPHVGADWQSGLLEDEQGKPPQFTTTASRYFAEDDRVKLKLNRKNKGAWTLGGDKPLHYINRATQQLVESGLSESEIQVMVPVSANEGDLNAINTWDNCFMTFGMFQWTLGTSKNKGELAALLNRLKDNEPSAFETYFGQYGLDISKATRTTGYLSIDGNRVDTVAEKEKFRSGPEWAYRFWLAGLDDRVKKVQVQHAVDRIQSFWTNDNYKPLGKFYISDLITSEYGVCLLLDHHVNRPGHLMNYAIGKKDIIGQALKRAGLQDTQAHDWGDAEEAKLIEAYLPLRFASSMTHSEHRAKRIKDYLAKGKLSKERHSFVPAPRPMASRSLDEPFVDPYPIINFEEYEQRGVE